MNRSYQARRILTYAGMFAACTFAHAHDLQHHVELGPPITLHFFIADNSKFSFETFEIFAPGDSALFQKGRTDKLGRVLLAPDRDGAWRVRVFSDDGHGTEVQVDIAASQTSKTFSRSLFDRHARVFTGAGMLLGLFGLVNLLTSLKKRGQKSS